MRTPRPTTKPRRGVGVGIGTLIGNGWLRESPRNVWPRGFEQRDAMSLRKCMFLPVMPELRELAPPFSPAAPLPPPPARPAPVVAMPRQRHPHRDVRMFSAVSAEEIMQRARAAKAPAGNGIPAPAGWYEDPVALGALLILVPPMGLAALWSSKRYSNDARWALTIMTALTLCLAAVTVVMVIALRVV